MQEQRVSQIVKVRREVEQLVRELAAQTIYEESTVRNLAILVGLPLLKPLLKSRIRVTEDFYYRLLEQARRAVLDG